MPRRAIGASEFDIVAQDAEGAMQLWRIIHQEPARFQAAQSLYLQICPDKLDVAYDDQWAMALEAMRPGNVRHSLKAVKIVVVGDRLFDPYSATTLAPSKVGDARLTCTRPSTSSTAAAARVFYAERALVKALSNIRGVEKVELAGPMEASLKKMLAVSMTTRVGEAVRDWRYGGGLRSEDDISWGSWSATMQPVGGTNQAADTGHKMKRFDCQSFLPTQAMQIVFDGNSKTNNDHGSSTTKERLLSLDGGFGSRKLGWRSKFGASSADVERANGHPGQVRSEMARGKSRSTNDDGGLHGNVDEYEEVVQKAKSVDGRGQEGAEVRMGGCSEEDAVTVDSDDPGDEDYRD